MWTDQPCGLANPDAYYKPSGQEYIADMGRYLLRNGYNGDVDALALVSLSQTPPYSQFEAGGRVYAGGVHPDEEFATSEIQDPHHSTYFLPFTFSLNRSPNTSISSVRSRSSSTPHELSRYQTPTAPGASHLTTRLMSSIEGDHFQQQQPQQYTSPAAFDYLDPTTTTRPLTTRGVSASPLSSSSSSPPPPSAAPPLLHVAARSRNRRIMTTLLKHGVSPNERDELGRTALHVAAALGDEALVALLLRCGADSGICDVHGQTALYMAVEGGYGEVVEMLLGGGYGGGG